MIEDRLRDFIVRSLMSDIGKCVNTQISYDKSKAVWYEAGIMWNDEFHHKLNSALYVSAR